MQQTLSTSSFKTKILRILAVLVTLTLIAGGVFVHSRIVRRINTVDDKSSFFKDSNYDVLFFGTSHVRMGIDPFQLYEDYGITSYNLATDGQEIPVSYYSFTEALLYNKPRVILLDVFRCSSNFPRTDLDLDASVINAHRIYDNFPLSKNKIKNTLDLYQYENVKEELLFPYIMYHNRWNEISFIDWKYFLCKNLNKAKGFDYERTPTRIEKYYKQVLCPSKETYLKNENTDYIEYIKKFVTYCVERDIQIILTYIPPALSDLQYEESNSIRELASVLRVPYYDMLYNADKIIDIDIDLYDSHLNLSGARKVTDYIGNILRNDFNVPDHRGESAYAKWDDDYKEYRECIFDKMRGINEFDVLLMACNFSDICVKLYKKENVAFDYVEEKLIAQLKDNISIFPVSLEESDSDLRIVIEDMETGSVVTEKFFNMGSALHLK